MIVGDAFDIPGSVNCIHCSGETVFVIAKDLGNSKFLLHTHCKDCKAMLSALESSVSAMTYWLANGLIVRWGYGFNFGFNNNSKKSFGPRCKYDGKKEVVLPLSSLTDNTDEVKYKIKQQLIPYTMKEWPKCSVDSMNKVEIIYKQEKTRISGSLRCLGCYPLN